MMAPPPQPVNERKYQAGYHGDMEPGYTHEMVYSGAGKYLPLFAGNGALVAHRQRNQNTGISMAWQCPHKTFANFLAQTLNLVSRATDHFVQTHVPIIFPNVAASP